MRDFLRQRHVPELTPAAKAVFVRDHVGVGFDATNKATRLALVSEDNGVCTVFAETVDVAKVNPLMQTVAQRAGAPLVEDGGHEADGFVTHFYKLTRFGRQFAVVISTGGRPDAPFHAALTLAPSK